MLSDEGRPETQDTGAPRHKSSTWCDVTKCLNASLGLSRIETGLGVTLTTTRLDPVFRTGVEIHPCQPGLSSDDQAGGFIKRKNSGNCHWLASPDRLRLTQSHKVSQYDRGPGEGLESSWQTLVTDTDNPPQSGNTSLVPASLFMVTGYSRVKCCPRLINVYIWWSQMVDRCGPSRDSAYIVTTTRGLSAQAHENGASRWERSGVHRSTNTITSPPIWGWTQNITKKQTLFKLKQLCFIYLTWALSIYESKFNWTYLTLLKSNFYFSYT